MNRELRPLAYLEHGAGEAAVELVARLQDLGREKTLFAIIAFEQLSDDHRIGEELPLQPLFLDDVVELSRLDPGRSLEDQQDLLEAGTRFGTEHNPTLIGRHVLDGVVDLRIEVALVHQPQSQGLGTVFGALRIEDAPVPLAMHFFSTFKGGVTPENCTSTFGPLMMASDRFTVFSSPSRSSRTRDCNQPRSR